MCVKLVNRKDRGEEKKEVNELTDCRVGDSRECNTLETINCRNVGVRKWEHDRVHRNEQKQNL